MEAWPPSYLRTISPSSLMSGSRGHAGVLVSPCLSHLTKFKFPSSPHCPLATLPLVCSPGKQTLQRGWLYFLHLLPFPSSSRNPIFCPHPSTKAAFVRISDGLHIAKSRGWASGLVFLTSPPGLTSPSLLLPATFFMRPLGNNSGLLLSHCLFFLGALC